MQKTWRVLSIDGGGTRGIIPATILASIEERTGKPIAELFDLIAGTSTGGILTLGLTTPDKNGKAKYSAKQLCDLYEQNVRHIFQRPKSWWGNLLGPKYRSFALQQVLKDTLGDTRLKNTLCDVLVPCYDIEHRLPYIFQTRLAKQDPEADFLVRDVALAASASPTLFYPVRIPRARATGRSICLVDGGVFANNPALSALAEVKSLANTEDDDCFIVSIGTGKSTRPLSDEFVSLWGYVQWSRPMLELVMESNSESVHEQINALLKTIHSPTYYRLQVEIPDDSNHAIDDASRSNVRALAKAARQFCLDKQNNLDLDQISKTLLKLSNENVAAKTEVLAR